MKQYEKNCGQVPFCKGFKLGCGSCGTVPRSPFSRTFPLWIPWAFAGSASFPGCRMAGFRDQGLVLACIFTDAKFNKFLPLVGEASHHDRVPRKTRRLPFLWHCSGNLPNHFRNVTKFRAVQSSAVFQYDSFSLQAWLFQKKYCGRLLEDLQQDFKMMFWNVALTRLRFKRFQARSLKSCWLFLHI